MGRTSTVYCVPNILGTKAIVISFTIDPLVKNGPYTTVIGYFLSIEDAINFSIIQLDFGIDAKKECKLVHCLVQESKKKYACLKNKRLTTPTSDDTKDDM